MVADIFDNLVAEIEYFEDGPAFCRIFDKSFPTDPAFLLERNGECFLLTDNVSDPFQHFLTAHDSTLKALIAAKKAIDRSPWPQGGRTPPACVGRFSVIL